MTKSIFHSLLLATLFIIPGTIKCTPTNEVAAPSFRILSNREALEELLALSRKQTQEIGFCIQHLQQILQAGNIALNKTDYNKVIEQLTLLAKTTQEMSDTMYTQNVAESLSQAVMLNSAIIEYLMNALNKGIASINIEELMVLLQKRIARTPSEQKILETIQKNTVLLEQLTYTVENIHLSLVNKLYRYIKNSNLPAATKATAVAAITTFGLSIIACGLTNKSQDPANAGIIERWVGAYPTDFITPLPANATIQERIFHAVGGAGNLFVNANAAVQMATGLNALGVGALLSSMYSQYWAQTTKYVSDKLSTLDQYLEGTTKSKVNRKDTEKVYFKNLIGCQDLEVLAKKLANFIKHPERYEGAQIEEHRGILLHGPPQTGKTLFAKALKTLIEEEMGSKIAFINAKEWFDAGMSIQQLFYEVKALAPCIVFIDEIDLVGANRDKNPGKTSQLLTAMNGIDSSKNIIVIGATNRLEQLDKALLHDGRFGKKILVDYPKYEYRKAFLEQELTKRCIQLEATFIDSLAQETEGCSYNILRRIITESITRSMIEMRPVNQQDFEITLDIEFRKIRSDMTMTQAEQKVIATYQAGKALARHILQTTRKVVKITVNPVDREVNTARVSVGIDNDTTENDKLVASKDEVKTKLGEVFTTSPQNQNSLISNDEQEKECLALLAGYAALEIVLNQSFAQCNKQDRAQAISIITEMISCGEKTDDTMRQKALAVKDQYLQRIKTLLQPHADLLIKISNVLLEKKTINLSDWNSLISQ